MPRPRTRLVAQLPAVLCYEQCNVVISDSVPHRRTIMWPHYDRDRISTLCHRRITLPYIRMVFGVRPVARDPFDQKYAIDLHLPFAVLGSLDPWDNLDQPLFALHLPNTSGAGFLTCAGSMPCNRIESPDVLVQVVSDAFWDSGFDGFCPVFRLEDKQPRRDIESLLEFYAGGLSSYRRLPCEYRLSDYVKPGGLSRG